MHGCTQDAVTYTNESGWIQMALSGCRASDVESRNGSSGGYAAGATSATSRHVRKAASRAARCWLALRRCQRRWKWLRIRLWVERKRCAWRADLKRFIGRSRRRVGWGGTSARLLRYRFWRCSRPGRKCTRHPGPEPAQRHGGRAVLPPVAEGLAIRSPRVIGGGRVIVYSTEGVDPFAGPATA